MKCKRVLKFYFCVDRLNAALDKIMFVRACSSGGAEEGADRIIEIIECKRELGELWEYLDGVLSTFAVGERDALEFYGNLRTGLTGLAVDKRREVKRTVMKFSRRARFLSRFDKQLKVLDAFRYLY